MFDKLMIIQSFFVTFHIPSESATMTCTYTLLGFEYIDYAERFVIEWNAQVSIFGV